MTDQHPDTQRKWYDSKAIVILLLILFFPVGLYALWKGQNFSTVVKGILTGVICLAVLGSMGDRPERRQSTSGTGSAPTSSQPRTQTASEPESKQKSGSLGVTKAGYEAIQNGMTREQVIAILGESGEELSRAGDGQYETAIYTWKAGFFGANMNVTFQGDRVMAKAQFGLK